jgi:hypothetical protein
MARPFRDIDCGTFIPVDRVKPAGRLPEISDQRPRLSFIGVKARPDRFFVVIVPRY